MQNLDQHSSWWMQFLYMLDESDYICMFTSMIVLERFCGSSWYVCPYSNYLKKAFLNEMLAGM
jgi:hypothetical protein